MAETDEATPDNIQEHELQEKIDQLGSELHAAIEKGDEAAIAEARSKWEHTIAERDHSGARQSA
jgi:hypothetical protein